MIQQRSLNVYRPKRFPLTPLAHDAVDEGAFIRLVQRLAAAKVDSITALGSTGSYAYLTSEERSLVTRLGTEHADGTPVFIGTGALRTSQVLTHAENAEEAEASGLLLAPVAYQPLTDDDVFEVFRTEIRKAVAGHVSLGVSGDAKAAAGLAAGCDAWYSAIGGTLPALAMGITKAAREGPFPDALAESDRLAPLWELFTEFGGSIRAIAAVAEHLGLAPNASLPRPIRGLTENQRERVAGGMNALGLQR